MKKKRPNNYKTTAYFQTLDKIYLIGCWAKYGYREFFNSGKVNKKGIPLVWDYYDGNGAYDEWHLIPITHTTTGLIYAWTPIKAYAKEISDALNNTQKISIVSSDT